MGMYRDALKELNEHPQERARSAWSVRSKYQPESIKMYSGPDDERYLKLLENEYRDDLSRTMKSLDDLRSHRP